MNYTNEPITQLELCASMCERHTSSKQVQVGMGSQHPEAVVVPAEGLDAGPLGHVPHSDALILRVGQDELLAWVEHGTRYIVVVPPTGVQLPCLRF